MGLESIVKSWLKIRTSRLLQVMFFVFFALDHVSKFLANERSRCIVTSSFIGWDFAHMIQRQYIENGTQVWLCRFSGASYGMCSVFLGTNITGFDGLKLFVQCSIVSKTMQWGAFSFFSEAGHSYM